MQIIDLSHPLLSDMPVYPGDPAVKIVRQASIEADGYCTARLALGTHAGTHVDFPAHLLPHGATQQQLPLEKFMGPGRVLNVFDKQIITAADLHGLGIVSGSHLSSCEFVLLYTGWAEQWGTKNYYHNWPYLAPDATSWLADQGFKGIGLDTPSPDSQGDESFAAHQALLEAGMVIVENLANLDLLPVSVNQEFIFQCLPLPVHNGEASPTRAVATLR